MSINIKIKWNICRICLKNISDTTASKCIFDKDDSGNDIFQKIFDCTGVEISKEVNLPDQICSNCIVYLKIAYKFRTLCRNSDKSLNEFQKKTEILSAGIQRRAVYEDEVHLQPEFVDTVSEADVQSNIKTEVNESEKEKTSKQSEELEVTSGNEILKESSIVHKKSVDTKDKSTQKETSSFMCHICGNQFHQKARLTCHERHHKKDKPYECEICFKSFGYNFLLTRHMRIHTGNKPYKCQYCHRRFTDQTDKVKHERIHTNERPYACEVCGKTFRLSHILNVHKMIHTGEKPFKCTLCGKKFTQRHKLKAHLLTQRHRMDRDKPEMTQMMTGFNLYVN